MANFQVTSDAEHASAGKRFCKSVNGKLTTNPDGSVTCWFSPADAPPETATRQSVSFPQKDIPAGRAICDQLGGKLTLVDDGASCDFVTPQASRWSLREVGKCSALIHVENDTSIIASFAEFEFSARTITCGKIVEECIATLNPATHMAKVILRGLSADYTEIHLERSGACLSLDYIENGKTIFKSNLNRDATVQSYAHQVREGRIVEKDLPYLSIFAREFSRNAPFQSDLLDFFGECGSTSSAPNGIGSFFCYWACRACEDVASPAACIACVGCKLGGWFTLET